MMSKNFEQFNVLGIFRRFSIFKIFPDRKYSDGFLEVLSSNRSGGNFDVYRVKHILPCSVANQFYKIKFRFVVFSNLLLGYVRKEILKSFVRFSDEFKVRSRFSNSLVKF